jgi:hypothetical protein
VVFSINLNGRLDEDGISATDTYAEQFNAWQLADGPTFSQRVTLTRSDMTKF